MDEKPLVRQERIKEASEHLRGSIKEELDSDSPSFKRKTTELLKFHGIYQQENRDLEKTKENSSLMIRHRIAGGRVTAKQWAGLDDIATRYGEGSIRLTTRQSVQFHYLLKQNLKATVQEIHNLLLTAIGACGDVVRNVMQSPNPLGAPEYFLLDSVACQISEVTKWKSSAYPEIWLDGKKCDLESEQEPLYGDQYLPRKFKIGLTIAGDNSLDLLSNDLGYAAHIQDNKIVGYHVYVGGGFGRSHNNPETYPRLADCLGWIAADQLLVTMESVISIQREQGNRSNRLNARLKYLVDRKGIENFRKEVEAQQGFLFEKRPEVPWKDPDYLGWHQQVNKKWALGLHILAGRIVDKEGASLKKAIRTVVDQFQPDLQLTPNQDLIFLNIEPQDKDKIDKIFSEANTSTNLPDTPVRNRALVCVAFPTCSLAIAESERVFPQVLDMAHEALSTYGLEAAPPIIRMTGCPNGCARPYSAELAFVGQEPESYQVWMGGSSVDTRMATHVLDKVRMDAFPTFFDHVFKRWKEERAENEEFGDFADRSDWSELKNQFLDKKNE